MSADKKFMEHRWGTRVDLDTPAEISTPTGFAVSGLLRDASVSGAFVETRARFALLSRVSVHALGREGEWLDACVVRVESKGIAVEWLEPGMRTVSGLLALRGSSGTQHAVLAVANA